MSHLTNVVINIVSACFFGSGNKSTVSVYTSYRKDDGANIHATFKLNDYTRQHVLVYISWMCIVGFVFYHSNVAGPLLVAGCRFLNL